MKKLNLFLFSIIMLVALSVGLSSCVSDNDDNEDNENGSSNFKPNIELYVNNIKQKIVDSKTDYYTSPEVGKFYLQLETESIDFELFSGEFYVSELKSGLDLTKENGSIWISFFLSPGVHKENYNFMGDEIKMLKIKYVNKQKREVTFEFEGVSQRVSQKYTVKGTASVYY